MFFISSGNCRRQFDPPSLDRLCNLNATMSSFNGGYPPSFQRHLETQVTCGEIAAFMEAAHVGMGHRRSHLHKLANITSDTMIPHAVMATQIPVPHGASSST